MTEMNSTDRYRIVRELGRGGIGIVYLAHDLQLHSRPVVIKVLQQAVEESANSAWFRKKFQQEIEALARINHPGIIGVLDSGKLDDGKPFFVMPFVEGISLRSAMIQRQFTLPRLAEIVRQISNALSAAHDKGVWHRDLKPENIMLERFSEDEELVRIIDFGIASVKASQVSPLKSGTHVVGTPGYMAPEQLRGNPTAASDIYALGIITWELLTGTLPFNETSLVELYEAQKSGVSMRPTQLRTDLPESVNQVLMKVLAFAEEDRFSQAREFGEAMAQALEGHLQSDLRSASLAAPPRIALLYKRNAEPDETLLQFLEAWFRGNDCRVFIDRHLSVGMQWAREIEMEIRSADVVIPLLSAASVTSEMLAYEIQIAHENAQQRGKPHLLPVRIQEDVSLPENLTGILSPIQYTLWKSGDDNYRVADELLRASLQASGQRETQRRFRPTIPTAQLLSSEAGSPLLTEIGDAPALRNFSAERTLEPVGGAVPLDSAFYIVRPGDEDFRAAITRQDSIVLVKGARQMGKTSLLARGLQQARSGGAKVVLTDFQKLNATHLESVDNFFLTIAEWIAEQLDIDALPEKSWSQRRGASINFERYLRREILSNISQPLVWGLDEVDRLFTCTFGSEVFGLFRSWHNERSLDPEGPWNRLTLAIAYATEAHLFITDLNQSPFNVGTRLTLEDFTAEQVAQLNTRYGLPLKGAEEVGNFYRLTGGQPYLVRRGLHEMSTEKLSLAAFASVADRDEGPFGDHLRRILVLLAQDDALCQVIREILKGNGSPDQESFYRLRSAGVMAGDSAGEVRPRCQLYASYLEHHLL
jgi:hypothetical protein